MEVVDQLRIVVMKINAIAGSVAATPIRPLFKGNSNQACSCCGCKKPSEANAVNNKNLNVDKFEKQ